MNAAQIIDKMIAYELDAENAPDFRQLIRDQRLALQSATNTGRVYGNDAERAEHIADVLAETRRVCVMYGITA